MNRLKYLGAAVVLLLAGAVFEPAAAQSFGGRWQASMPTRVENVNGVETALDSVIIEFTLEQRGDSVFGSSKALGGPGATRPPRKLSGRVQNGTLTLLAEPVEATIRNDGGESRMMMTTTYVLKIDGEALTGTQESASTDGSIGSMARPFRARRGAA